MHPGAVIFCLGWGGVALSAAMVVPLGWAVFQADHLPAGRFLLSLLISGFISVALVLVGRTKEAGPVRKTDLFTTAVLFYLLLPVPAAVPFVSAGQGVGFWAAYFEAVSGLTTTGATLYSDPAQAGATLLIWRSVLGWLGGLAVLSLGVALMAPNGLFGVGLKPLNIRQDASETLPQRLRRSVNCVFKPYLGLTLAGLAAVGLTGAPFFDTLSLTLNAVSTTGFASGRTPLEAHLSLQSLAALGFLMVAGSLSYPLLIAARRLDASVFREDREVRDYALAVVFLSAAFILLFRDSGLVVPVVSAVNMLSTTAFVISPPEKTLSHAPAAVFFLPVLIGGMTLSTAGGLKVLRFSLLLRRVGYEIVNLPYPNSVESMHYGGKFVTGETMASVWGLFLVYFAGFVAGFLALSFLTGGFETAWLLALALLNNAGGVLHMAGIYDLPAGMPPIGHILMSLIMILGRLEFIVVLVLLLPRLLTLRSQGKRR